MCKRFQEVFKAVETEAATTTEEIWAKLKTGLLEMTEVCGTTKPHQWRHKTWWWIRKWMMPIVPSPKLSKHGRLANAHEHHITLPNASPDV